METGYEDEKTLSRISKIKKHPVTLRQRGWSLGLRIRGWLTAARLALARVATVEVLADEATPFHFFPLEDLELEHAPSSGVRARSKVSGVLAFDDKLHSRLLSRDR